MRVLQQVENAVQAEKLRSLTEVDAREAYRAEAQRSAADWLADVTGMTQAEARRQTRLAAAMDRLPRTRAQLAAGTITASHAAAAAHGLIELDRHAAARRQEAGEDMAAWEAADAAAEATAAAFDAMVAEQAPCVDRSVLARRIDVWTRAQVPDAVDDRERRALVHRGVHIAARRNRDGLWSNRVDLTDAAQAQFLAAVEPLARKTGTDDDRTIAQRRHDALATLAANACDTGDLPTVAAQRPHVIVIRDHRPDAEHPDWIAGIGPVSSNTARLFACDADTTVFTTTPDGQTWDVGRSNGDPTRIQRLAVIARDKACVGCGAPAYRCQLHHIRYRSRNGATAVSNLVLVCWACHQGIHSLGWTITGTPDTGYAINKTPARTAGGTDPPRHTP